MDETEVKVRARDFAEVLCGKLFVAWLDKSDPFYLLEPASSDRANGFGCMAAIEIAIMLGSGEIQRRLGKNSHQYGGIVASEIQNYFMELYSSKFQVKEIDLINLKGNISAVVGPLTILNLHSPDEEHLIKYTGWLLAVSFDFDRNVETIKKLGERVAFRRAYLAKFLSTLQGS